MQHRTQPPSNKDKYTHALIVSVVLAAEIYHKTGSAVLTFLAFTVVLASFWGSAK